MELGTIEREYELKEGEGHDHRSVNNYLRMTKPAQHHVSHDDTTCRFRKQSVMTMPNDGHNYSSWLLFKSFSSRRFTMQ